MAKKLTKYEKDKQEIKRLLTLIPKTLPKGLKMFLDRTCLQKHHHILYDKKKAYAFCSCCGKKINQKFKVERFAKHGESGQCPQCKEWAIYRSMGRHRSKYICDEFQVSWIQKTNEGIVLRRFDYARCLSWNNEFEVKKTMACFEIQRIYNDAIKPKRITPSPYSYRLPNDWCFSQRTNYSVTSFMGNYKEIPSFEYREGLESLLENTPWKYAKLNMHLEYYAGWIKPCELLEKLGFENLSSELTHFRYAHVSYKAQSLTKFMRLPKHLVSLVRVWNLGQYDLGLVQKLNNQGTSHITEDLINFCRWNTHGINECCKLSPLLNYEKIAKYIMNETCEKHRYVSDYKDYLGFCHKLSYDLTDPRIVFPNNLKAAHDREMVRIKIQQEAGTNNAIIKRYAMDHKRYYYVADGYFIDAPKDIGEIIAEGSALHHCVGTYAKAVAERQTTILFVRRIEEPEKPFATMEIQSNRIVQIRTDNNGVPDDDVKAFVLLWQKEKLYKKSIKKQADKPVAQAMLQAAI